VEVQDCTGVLAISSFDNRVTLYKPPSKEPLSRISEFGPIKHIAFHPFEKWAFVLSTKKYGLVIMEPLLANKPRTEENLNPMFLPMSEYNQTYKNLYPTHMDYSPDGKLLAMVNKFSCVLTIWNIELDTVSEYTSYRSTLNKVKFSPDGSYLAITSKESRSLILYETGTWSSMKRNFEHPISKFAWESNANSIYLYFKESARIKILKDNQVERVSTIYKNKPIDFEYDRTINLDSLLPQDHKVNKVVFVMEPKVRKVFVNTVYSLKEYDFLINLDNWTQRLEESRALLELICKQKK